MAALLKRIYGAKSEKIDPAQLELLLAGDEPGKDGSSDGAVNEALDRLAEEGLHLDLLIRARKEAYEASFRQLKRGLLEVTEELCSGRLSWR